MDIKQLLGAFSATIFRIVLAVIVIIFVYKAAVTAYDFGFNVFADIPVSEGEGRTVSVVVSNPNNTKELGAVLEQKGLIRDKNVFYIQEKLSDYHGKLEAGTYELNTAMSVEKMLRTMCNMEEIRE